ncbi:MAG: nucleotidyltransferase [Verrucomicrobia bacterium]|nr:nucleotidyltransferase [Verrucomicrobiota bacterium]
MHKLHKLLRRLAEAGVDFVVVGGYAAVIHGSAYVTNDVDVCAVLSADNVEKIRKALADVNPVHRQMHRKLSFLEVPPPGQPLQNLYLETDDGIIDILTSVLGVGDFARLRERAMRAEFSGVSCAVISLEDLIAAKEAMGRERDILTVKELRAIAAKRRLAAN